MKRYQVNYTDLELNCTSPIDIITEKEGYTAEDYIRDCDANADEEWCDMLHSGEVSLVELDD